MGRGKVATQETAAKKARFLEEYKTIGNTEATALTMTEAGVHLSRFTVYKWLDSDETFAAEYALLKERRTDQIEDNVYLIASGQKDASKSELLAGIFWLTHNRREKYGGKQYAGDSKDRGNTVKVIRETIIKNYDKRTLTLERETKTLEAGAPEGLQLDGDSDGNDAKAG